MGLGFSIDSYLDGDKNGPKAAILLSYEKESLRPVAFTDFVENPLSFASAPLILLEPFTGTPAPIVAPSVQGVSFPDTMRVFHQHFRIQNFRLPTQSVWIFSPTKVPKATIAELMTYIRTAPLQNYSSRRAVEAPSVFTELTGISSLKAALRPPPQTSQVRASSPIRAAGQICGTATGNLLSRRSHNAGFKGTFVLPIIPQMEFKEEAPPDDMNMIIPGIFVGGERAAANKQLLIDNHVTHIINLSGTTTREHFPDSFKYLTLYMHDNDFEDIPPSFWEAISFLKKAMDSGGTTLVHCRRGICRSAALVAAYLNEEKSVPIDTAISMIKKKRPIININPGFLDQLHLREKLAVKIKPKARLLSTLPKIKV